MDTKDTNPKGTTDANDDVTENAHYENGEINHIDKRDRKNSMDDWDAEGNRSGRHK